MTQRMDLVEEALIESLGKALATRLAMLVRTVRVHSVNNAALQYSVRSFAEALGQLHMHTSEVSLRGDDESVFLGDLRLRLDPVAWDMVRDLMAELADRRCGGIAFHVPLDPVGVRKLLQLLLDFPALTEAEGARKLNAEVDARGIPGVTFLPRMRLVTEAHLAPQQEAAGERMLRLYAELQVAFEAYVELKEGEVPEVVRNRILHAAQAVVDIAHEEPDWLLAAATQRDPLRYLSTHAVNMTLLSVAIGQRLEFGRKTLLNLAMSAVYADAGFRRLPYGLDGKPTDREGARWELHPLRSVMEILQTPALTRGQRDRIMVAYEHQLGRDGSGYPRAVPGKPLHIFSAIVGLADSYDALTSFRPSGDALAPPRALEAMVAQRHLYEPRLLSLLLFMLGPWPPGTVVTLSNGERGVVQRRGAHDRPLIKVIADAAGRPVRPSARDLADPALRNLTIRGFHDASALPEGVDPVRVLFAHAG